MSDISEEQRATVLALLQEGVDSPQIAERAGLSVGTVRAIKANLTMGRYAEKEVQEVAEAIETTFGLERDLQGALRSNISQLEPGMKIIDGGNEQIVPSGRIDITAQDDRGATVVIELKAGAADRDAIGQVLSYMGDLGAAGGPPRGILVAGDFLPRAISAARAVPNLQLKKYSFKFSFESVD
jgi:endonuclease